MTCLAMEACLLDAKGISTVLNHIQLGTNSHGLIERSLHRVPIFNRLAHGGKRESLKPVT